MKKPAKKKRANSLANTSSVFNRSVSTYGKIQTRLINDIPCSNWLPTEDSFLTRKVKDIFDDSNSINITKHKQSSVESPPKVVFSSDTDADEDFKPMPGKRNRAVSRKKKDPPNSKKPVPKRKEKAKRTKNSVTKSSNENGSKRADKWDKENLLPTKNHEKVDKKDQKMSERTVPHINRLQNNENLHISEDMFLCYETAASQNNVNEASTQEPLPAAPVNLTPSPSPSTIPSDILNELPNQTSNIPVDMSPQLPEKAEFKRPNNVYVDSTSQTNLSTLSKVNTSFNSTVVQHAANIEMYGNVNMSFSFQPNSTFKPVSDKAKAMAQSTPFGAPKTRVCTRSFLKKQSFLESSMKDTHCEDAPLACDVTKKRSVKTNNFHDINGASNVGEQKNSKKEKKSSDPAEVFTKPTKRKPQKPVKKKTTQKTVKKVPVWKKCPGSVLRKTSKKRAGNDSILQHIMYEGKLDPKFSCFDDFDDVYHVNSTGSSEADVLIRLPGAKPQGGDIKQNVVTPTRSGDDKKTQPPQDGADKQKMVTPQKLDEHEDIKAQKKKRKNQPKKKKANIKNKTKQIPNESTVLKFERSMVNSQKSLENESVQLVSGQCQIFVNDGNSSKRFVNTRCRARAVAKREIGRNRKSIIVTSLELDNSKIQGSFASLIANEVSVHKTCEINAEKSRVMATTRRGLRNGPVLDYKAMLNGTNASIHGISDKSSFFDPHDETREHKTGEKETEKLRIQTALRRELRSKPVLDYKALSTGTNDKFSDKCSLIPHNEITECKTGEKDAKKPKLQTELRRGIRSRTAVDYKAVSNEVNASVHTISDESSIFVPPQGRTLRKRHAIDYRALSKGCESTLYSSGTLSSICQQKRRKLDKFEQKHLEGSTVSDVKEAALENDSYDNCIINITSEGGLSSVQPNTVANEVSSVNSNIINMSSKSEKDITKQLRNLDHITGRNRRGGRNRRTAPPVLSDQSSLFSTLSFTSQKQHTSNDLPMHAFSTINKTEDETAHGILLSDDENVATHPCMPKRVSTPITIARPCEAAQQLYNVSPARAAEPEAAEKPRFSGHKVGDTLPTSKPDIKSPFSPLNPVSAKSPMDMFSPIAHTTPEVNTTTSSSSSDSNLISPPTTYAVPCTFKAVHPRIASLRHERTTSTPNSERALITNPIYNKAQHGQSHVKKENNPFQFNNSPRKGETGSLLSPSSEKRERLGSYVKQSLPRPRRRARSIGSRHSMSIVEVSQDLENKDASVTRHHRLSLDPKLRSQILDEVKVDLSSAISEEADDTSAKDLHDGSVTTKSVRSMNNTGGRFSLPLPQVLVTPLRDSFVRVATSCGRVSLHSLGFVNALTPSRARADNGRILTAREKVLYECDQTEPISFEQALKNVITESCVKLGEGLYGEVFRCSYEDRSEPVAIKIIPIEGDLIVNNEKQKTFEEVLPEIVSSKELHALRDADGDSTEGFIELYKMTCARGRYPDFLIEAWDKYDEEKASDNDRPNMFPDDQLYLIFQFTDGGTDLEHYKFKTASQALSVLQQVCAALAIAEKSLEFEHRDLHWGNILVTETTAKTIPVAFDDRTYEITSHGVKASIIDFTLSRLSKGGVTVYQDLSTDPELFTLNAEQDYQFEIYRLMQKATKNKWSWFQPKTNVFWIHYLADKFCNEVKYKSKKSRLHRSNFRKIYLLKEKILDFGSCLHLFQSADFIKGVNIS